MIVLTGAGGFIGSYVLGYLNKQGIRDVVIYDNAAHQGNLVNKQYLELRSANDSLPDNADAVIHLGANSNTLERDWSSINKTNVESTRTWYQWSQSKGIPMIYASSAAILGNGSGPLNQYAFSKQVNEQECKMAAGLRLYNVYGPNESHKGRMASTIYNWYQQIRSDGTFKIFEHSDRYFRDFIYVEDVAKTILYLIENFHPGVYPLGTGRAVSFETVADTLISIAGGRKIYVPMPEDLQAQYQTNTCADTNRLEKIGLDIGSFLTIEQGIDRYVPYLAESKIY